MTDDLAAEGDRLCPDCEGAGRYVQDDCSTCDGTGYVVARSRLLAAIRERDELATVITDMVAKAAALVDAKAVPEETEDDGVIVTTTDQEIDALRVRAETAEADADRLAACMPHGRAGSGIETADALAAHAAAVEARHD